jgi:hypothetical protein
MRRGIDDYIELAERARLVDEARARRKYVGGRVETIAVDKVSAYPHKVSLTAREQEAIAEALAPKRRAKRHG